MNGRDLALGLVGALAVAGAVRKRGSATRTAPVKTVPVERFWTIPSKLEETLTDIAEGRRSYSYDAPLRVSALDTPRGHYFVLDGHHRLVERIQAGDRTVGVELDAHLPRIERTGGGYRDMVAQKVNIAARVRRGSASRASWPGVDTLARTFTDTMASATVPQMKRWAKKHGLVYIGSGESRAVFAEPDGTRVLKLVFSSYGREANQSEARAWREAKPSIRALLVPVLASDPEGSWLVMERVKTMRANQYAPKETMEALRGCGFLDLRRPNFSSDGRVLDYGLHIWSLWKDGCRAEGSADRGSQAEWPDRLYHGTKHTFDSFDVAHPGKKDFGWLGRGVYLTDNEAAAQIYARIKRGPDAPRVMTLRVRPGPLYPMSIQEKERLRHAGPQASAAHTRALQAQGYIGAVLDHGPGHGREFVVFDPRDVTRAAPDRVVGRGRA